MCPSRFGCSTQMLLIEEGWTRYIARENIVCNYSTMA